VRVPFDPWPMPVFCLSAEKFTEFLFQFSPPLVRRSFNAGGLSFFYLYIKKPFCQLATVVVYTALWFFVCYNI